MPKTRSAVILSLPPRDKPTSKSAGENAAGNAAGEKADVETTGERADRDSAGDAADLKKAREKAALRRYAGQYSRLVLNVARMRDQPAQNFDGSDDHQLLYIAAMRPGWFKMGGWRDVPHDARYVGQYSKTYVWVPPENVEMLTLLTFAILDIHSTKDPNHEPPKIR
jgi:hypothetical protein